MENRDELQRLEQRMSELWGTMEFHRERGDWGRYWNTRRAWIAAGRYHGLLYAREQQQTEEQRALFDVSAFRPHDPAA